MTERAFLKNCRGIIADYYNEHADKSDDVTPMSVEDVYVVWYCKSLQNHKALLSMPVPDGMYYECTYNGDKGELYIDAYKKFENRVIRNN